MAYTIISQNNSTTTLSDGVNTITVPSRVNLTSGNFTIVEVNNNMATLEDGDGNVYRDIPCVATLAGEGGGGGSGLPDQTGHSGEFLTTDGSSASWSDKPLVNTADATGSLGILGSTSTGNTTATAVGYNASCSGSDTTALGNGATASVRDSTAIGKGAVTSARAAIQIGEGTNSTAGTVCFGFEGTNYTILDANKEIPTDRLTNAINKYSSMPTAGADYLGQIAQFTGTTDATYTHGYIYECVSDGATPPTYSWAAVSVQAGGSSLPSQTGNSGKFLTTDGTSPSWSDKPLQNTATGTDGLTILGTSETVNYAMNIGIASESTQLGGVAIGRAAKAKAESSSTKGVAVGINAAVIGESGVAVGGNSVSYRGTDGSGYGVAVGGYAQARDYGIAIGGRVEVGNAAIGSIQLGSAKTDNITPTQNNDAHTFKVGLRTGTNYELLSSDGTIPTARLTKVNTTVTLASAGWSGGSQTVTVTGMTATGIALVSPDPTDQSAYTSAGIICTAQAANSLTFTATTTPSGDIDVNIVCL